MNTKGTVWVLKKCPNGVEYDELDLAVHFLFDDTSLSTSPEKLVGVILRNKEEAAAIKTLCFMLDKIFATHGVDKSDEEYIELEEWFCVVDLASRALLLCKNEDPVT